MADEDVLTFEQAVARLPDGETVHTFRNTAFMLIGADWDRESLLEALKTHRVELAGPEATAMHHGMVIFDDHGALFIETRR